MKAKLVLVVMSLVVAAIVAPSVLANRFEIDRKGFRYSGGFWFAPKVQDIRFADADRPRLLQVRANEAALIACNDASVPLSCLPNSSVQAASRGETNREG